MKNSSFFRAQICAIFGIFLLAVISCNSTSSNKGNDIWSLLGSGDSRARGFFLGEVDVNQRDPDGKTPLHYAAENSDLQLAAFFISLGANTNALDNGNQSPLGISVARDDIEIAELLVKSGANIHLPLNDDATAAKIAMTKGGRVFKSILTPASVESVDANGRTVLHLASIDGNVKAISEILTVLPDSSSTLDKKDEDRQNALDYALKRTDSKAHMQAAEQLILAGANSENPVFYYFAPAVRSANYNIRRSEGFAPLHYAVSDNYFGLITFLFEKGADVNIKSTSGATPLHEAARVGNINTMRMLINEGANVNSRDAKGNTPLHTGIPSNVHKEAADLLLERGANPNLRDEHGDTPLHIIIILNRPLDVIQTMLGGGSDVHIRNIEGKTPLYIAIQEKRKDLIPVLISYGSELFAADNSGITPFDIGLKDGGDVFNLLVTPETAHQRDSAGNTVLHAAVKNRGTPQQIGIILDQRALVDARNMEGDTALHIAVRTNQRENGEFLISRGANIFEANAEGVSPLYLALTGGREWMINPTTITARDGLGNNMLHYAAQWKMNSAIPFIIHHGISVEDANATGETPLFFAVKTDSPSTITTLINNMANLNARDKQGNTVLHAAVRWNARNSAALLVSSGIDINAHSLNGSTPLHDAVALGMTNIEAVLIKEGADLEVRDLDGNTPFMEAVRAGFIPSIEMLAYNGADTQTRNIKGDTPLHTAVAMERYDLVNMLLRMGASIHARNTANRTPFQNSLRISPRMVSALLTKDGINIPDDMGNSALHIALQEKASSDILRTIISQGARINAVDNNGKTPLRLAVDMGQWSAVKVLADSGADPFLAAVDNKTPAEIAFVKGEDCIRALFSGKGINAKDSSANTILHLAARYGNPETISILLELGANKSLKNIAMEVPADIASRWNRGENIELLR